MKVNADEKCVSLFSMPKTIKGGKNLKTIESYVGDTSAFVAFLEVEE